MLSPIEQAKTGRCSGLRPGAPDDRLVLVDVGDDRRDLVLRVAEHAQCARHGLVHDRHVAAADELLELHETEVGLDTRSCHSPSSRPMVPVGASTDAWAFRTPWRVAEVDGLFPGALGRLERSRRAP